MDEETLKNHENQSRQLVETCLARFAELGYDGAAKKLGKNRGTIYNYANGIRKLSPEKAREFLKKLL